MKDRFSNNADLNDMKEVVKSPTAIMGSTVLNSSNKVGTIVRAPHLEMLA